MFSKTSRCIHNFFSFGILRFENAQQVFSHHRSGVDCVRSVNELIVESNVKFRKGTGIEIFVDIELEQEQITVH